MPEFEMVCLANSRKRQGCCIAGLKTDGSGWLRPVGTGPEGGLVPWECRLPDGSVPKLLDTIRVPCAKAQPRPHQPENWVVGDGQWQRVSRPAKPTLTPLMEAALHTGTVLLGGVFDRVRYEDLEYVPARASLALVAPSDLHWRTALMPEFKRRTRAVFRLGHARYDLSVTDPLWEKRLCALPEGEHDLIASGVAPTQRVLLTVSLGEPFHGDCYKLVAGVIVI